ncbi:uncharacterized protein MAM_06744 [Metarhizium album ARSEF 1941]|uniref:Integral membrane protein n=1 Tax=Metarhizium album (strain ARSEF 1941) TaxID=1081103 RepID=A0A0B2WPQ9_METAS|nr:uncharacterized protein MAM_06744 [Metarhizium album ARSEF 1941]KHN95467.1 hypothetical protein MAM_06744 [Metarhizium album ARSEF 1941]
MIFALFFVCTRISQIVTLIPAMGMLAWFINVFVGHNALTPDPILILFILVVLALAWAVFTLLSYRRSSASARFVCLVDACFMGALIAGVYEMRGIADATCSSSPDAGSVWFAPAHVPVPNWGWEADKPCAMLKASWAFAIMNIVFFAATALAAYSHGDELAYGGARREIVVERRRHHHHHHSSRHGHRRRSRSGGSRRSSHRSPHSHRRVYV